MSTSYEERRWKLGQGMCSDEYILDPVSFDDLILALRCNYGQVSESEIMVQAKEIIEQRLEDYWYLVEHNLYEIEDVVNGDAVEENAVVEEDE